MRMRGFRVTIFLFISCLLHADCVKLDFDQPFFETSFVKVFDSCMKVCQDIDLLDCFKCTGKDCELVTDILVGKLFALKTIIEKAECKIGSVCEQDLCYIENMLGNVLCAHNSVYVKQLVNEIKATLRKLSITPVQ